MTATMTPRSEGLEAKSPMHCLQQVHWTALERRRSLKITLVVCCLWKASVEPLTEFIHSFVHPFIHSPNSTRYLPPARQRAKSFADFLI